MGDGDDDVESLLDEIGQDYPECGFSVGHGWFPVVADALRKMSKYSGWRLLQVKQKFCQLRIYVENSCDEVNEIIDRAADRCDVLCELCGGFASPGWRTGSKLCAVCAERMNPK